MAVVDSPFSSAGSFRILIFSSSVAVHRDGMTRDTTLYYYKDFKFRYKGLYSNQ